MSPRWIIRRAVGLGLVAAIAIALVVAGDALGRDRVLGDWPPLDDPLLAATEVVRLAALAAAGWLLVITVLDTVASMVRARPVLSLTQRLVPSFWRHLALRPAMALAVVVPPVIAPITHMAPTAAQTVANETVQPQQPSADGIRSLTMVVAPGAGRSPGDDEPTAVLTMRRHQPEPDRGEETTTAEAIAGDSAERPEAPPESSTHAAISGDNLWSIAAAHLTNVRGERPHAREIAPYWRALIDANRSVLPDPDNPDLLFPGVQLTLPPAG
jgi:hypothetical protein